MNNTTKTETFKDRYERLEWLLNLLHHKIGKVYDMQVLAEQDPQRRKDMESYKALGNEVGNQMGIVWTLHELYRAKTDEELDNIQKVYEAYQNKTDQDEDRVMRELKWL